MYEKKLFRYQFEDIFKSLFVRLISHFMFIIINVVFSATNLRGAQVCENVTAFKKIVFW
jgi:hypothetical protein